MVWVLVGFTSNFEYVIVFCVIIDDTWVFGLSSASSRVVSQRI